jgi:alcohol dehydrogenase (NADP+)
VYCAEVRGFAFCDDDHSAFGNNRIMNAGFAYLMSDEVDSPSPGPLICAGASTFQALHAAKRKPGERVGVVSVGGLGHKAILFAKAMDCNVTVISCKREKFRDTFKLGADECRWMPALRKSWSVNHSAVPSPESMSIDVVLITSNEVPKLDELPLSVG